MPTAAAAAGACEWGLFCGRSERDNGNELRLASLCDFVSAQLLACSAPCGAARPEEGWFGVEVLLDAWGCPEALQHQCVL